jgi:hypothetical protein
MSSTLFRLVGTLAMLVNQSAFRTARLPLTVVFRGVVKLHYNFHPAKSRWLKGSVQNSFTLRSKAARAWASRPSVLSCTTLRRLRALRCSANLWRSKLERALTRWHSQRARGRLAARPNKDRPKAVFVLRFCSKCERGALASTICRKPDSREPDQ